MLVILRLLQSSTYYETRGNLEHPQSHPGLISGGAPDPQLKETSESAYVGPIRLDDDKFAKKMQQHGDTRTICVNTVKLLKDGQEESPFLVGNGGNVRTLPELNPIMRARTNGWKCCVPDAHYAPSTIYSDPEIILHWMESPNKNNMLTYFQFNLINLVSWILLVYLI